MGLTRIEIALDDDMIAVCREMAQEQDITIGQLVRATMAKEISRRKNAKTPNRADEQLVARLQRLLVPEMAVATGWADIQARLARLGYALRPAGGGLVLHAVADGARLCKSSELGFAYARLVRRFGAPMPGHPHRMPHILANNPVPAGTAADLDLIERF